MGVTICLTSLPNKGANVDGWGSGGKKEAFCIGDVPKKAVFQ